MHLSKNFLKKLIKLKDYWRPLNVDANELLLASTMGVDADSPS
jgi:hypothetical protein